jgi:hypothetical protein
MVREDIFERFKKVDGLLCFGFQQHRLSSSGTYIISARIQNGKNLSKK